jgi:biotin carboxyl carrier protein
MPGVIVRLAVQEGERVAAGDLLLTLEAMKMQNELRAPRAGQVRGLAAKPGQKVDKSTLLLVLDEP